MAQLQSTSITGSLIVTQGITGSFSGSITNAVSASYAATASYALNAGDSVWTGSAGNIYYSGGNVGIGTASPNTKLHVWNSNTGNNVEVARFTSAYAGTGDGPLVRFTNYLSYATNPNAGEYNLAGIRAYDFASSWGGALQFLTSTTVGGGGNLVAAMTIDQTQQVGIGTTSPAVKLDIFGLTNTSIFNIRQTGGILSQIESDNGYANLFLYQAGGNPKIGLVSNGSSYFNGGNVGIGTTNPSYRLHVLGTNPRVFIQDSSTGYPILQLSNNSSGNFFISIDNSAGSGFGSAYGRFLYSEGAYPMIFVTNSAEAMRITSGGYVGIGTTNPSFPLSVQGIAQARGGVYVTQAAPTNTLILNADDTSLHKIYTNASVDLSLGTNSSTSQLYLKSGGNVGIGTTSPAGKLHIAATSGVASPGTIALAIRDAGSSTFGFDFNLEGVSTGDLSLMRVVSGVQSQVMTFDRASGNVGIGTTSPTSPLHVYNNADIWHTRIGGASGELRIGGQTASGAVIQAYTPAGSQRDLYIQRDGGSVGIGTFSPTATLQINGAGGDSAPTLRLISAASDTFNWASDSRYANLTAGESSIHIIGKANSQYNQAYIGYRHVADGSASNMLTLGLYAADYLVNILGNGNVGIGTTVPSAKLEVYGVNGSIAILGSGYTINPVPMLIGQYTSTRAYIQVPNQGTFEIWNGGTAAIAEFKNNSQSIFNGDVGIGTTNPSAKLQTVSSGLGDGGGIRITNSGAGGDDYRIWPTATINGEGAGKLIFTNSGGNVLTLTSSGNVGIGTFSPGYKLDINGNTNITGDLYFNSNTALQAARKYVSTAILSNAGYTVIGTVTGDALASSIRISIQGTASSVVINVMADILVNHYQDILITSYAGIYTILTLRVVSDNNALYSIEATTNSANACTTYIEIFPLNSETVVFGGSAQTGTSLTHPCVPGMYVSATGGSSGNLAIGGDVGIGTTSPGYKLEVNGTLGVNGNATFNGGNVYINSDYSYIGNNTTDLVSLSGGTMYLPGNGNVGIGITNPGYKLEINGGSIGSNIARFTTGGGGGGTRGLTVYSDNSQVKLQVTDNAGSLGTWAFLNLNPDGGYVGIGTTNPSAKLQVAGEIRASLGSTYGYVSLQTGGATVQGYVEWFKPGPTRVGYMGYNDGNSANNIGLNLESSANFVINGGNVGIGTTSPIYKLHVSNNANGFISRFTGGASSDVNIGIFGYTGAFGSIGTESNHPLNIFTSGTDRMTISTSGNVGIGTTSPATKLDVDGNTTIRGSLAFKTTGTNNGNLVISDNGGGTATINNSVNSFLDISAASLTTVTVGNFAVNSNVGIGTTSPGYKLDVVSSNSLIARFNGSAVVASSATEIEVLGPQSNGELNLGVGGSTLSNSTNNIQNKGFITAGTGLDGLNLRSDQGYVQITAGGITSANEVARFTAAGNVGIGTASPESIVHIAQANSGGKTILYIDNNASSALNNEATIKFSVDAGASSTVGGAEISTVNVNAGNGNSDLTFKTFNASSGLTEKVRITNDGNVGIGTTSPAYKLSVLTTGTLGFSLLTNTSTVGGPQIDLYDSGRAQETVISSTDGTTVGTYIASYSNHPLLFGTYAASTPTAKMTILPGGNVGIGTASPTQKLEVNGSTWVSGTVYINRGVNSTEGYTYFDHPGTQVWKQGIFSDNTSTFSIGNGGGFTRLFNITNAGNVGIGITNPSEKLAVAGRITLSGSEFSFSGDEDKNITVFSNRLLNLRTNDTTRVTITGSGNVGIGTTSPATKLHVVGDQILDDGTNGRLTFSLESGENNVYSTTTGFGSYKPLRFTSSEYTYRIGGTEIMRITNSGNVGIGTTSPTAKLNVIGSIRVSDGTDQGYVYFRQDRDDVYIGENSGYQLTMGAPSGVIIETDSNNNGFGLFNVTRQAVSQFYIGDNGNVGINVATPQAKLQVSGSSNVLNVRGSGSATTSSIFSVDGNNGRLFEVSDDLSNSLFSVNTIAGLPVIEAFADYTVTMGTYGAYTLQVTGSRVGVGTSSPGYPLHVSGSVSGISIYATNDIAAFSDQSVKTDLQVIDSAVDRIKQINGYTYVRVDDLSNTRRAGVIAQEVQKVLPEVVSENQDGTLNVAYSNMIALLIEGMKEQQSQIDKLREDLEDLRYEL
jgi:hypothetical protein